MTIPSGFNDRLTEAANREVNSGVPSLGVTLDSALAGENLTSNRMMVQQTNSYAYSAAVGTTTIKGSAGFLHGIALGSTSAGGAVVIYDSASGTTATIIGQIPASAAAGFYTFDVNATNGIVVANVGTQIYTVSYT